MAAASFRSTPRPPPEELAPVDDAGAAPAHDLRPAVDLPAVKAL